MRRHLSYANVMATLALFFALAGGSYAAIKLPKNSVTSTQIRNGSITGADIKNNSVKGADVDESSLAQVPSAKRADAATTADKATSATKAATADSATKATTADSATSAANAANADKLDGQDSTVFELRCPTGTRPKWGACLELNAHDPATAIDAIEDCSRRGGRLPTALELAWVGRQADIAWAQGQGNGQHELTGEAGTAALTVLAPDNQGNTESDPVAGTPYRYRCVLAQVNG